MPKEYKYLTFKDSSSQRSLMENEINKLSAQGWNLKSNNLNSHIFNIIMEKDIDEKELENKNKEELEKKQNFEKFRKKKILVISIIVILFIVFTTYSNIEKVKIEQMEEYERISMLNEKYKDVHVIFNANEILSSSVNDLVNIFGKPQKIDKDDFIWTGYYTKNDRNINITYNSKTNNIINIFYAGDDIERLKRELNLNTINNLDIKEVKDSDDAIIIGIKVTNKTDNTVVEICTKSYIEDNAKNPDSIKFPMGSVDSKYLGGKDYLVYGSFSGTNSFGGRIKTNFICNSTVIDSKNYICTSSCKFD